MSACENCGCNKDITIDGKCPICPETGSLNECIPEMVLVPLDRYLENKADNQLRKVVIEGIEKVLKENPTNLHESISEILRILG